MTSENDDVRRRRKPTYATPRYSVPRGGSPALDRHVRVRLPGEMVEQLDAIAGERGDGCTRSDVIREILSGGLSA